ncbi:MAG: hypothetical protein GY702_02225 [Desulfobulbaceae bacterium]|nr:hypothetical protein [Desulfobulbaceae bacterium]
MPNTLCHIAIQAPLSRSLISPVELIWVVVGCLLPDLPWIALKLLLATGIFDPYDLRLYFTAQASLFFVLVLAGGLAMWARKTWKVFLIIGANVSLHLLLDAVQIKWGNGVHFFAPFDWEMFHLDLFWPEHLLTVALTIFGLFYLVLMWRPITQPSNYEKGVLYLPNAHKLLAGALLFFIYFAAPFTFLGAMEETDTYYIKTMRHVSERPGKTIEFDRAHYFAENQQIRIYSGEQLQIVGPQPKQSGRVSFKGTFINTKTLLSDRYHYHQDFRDVASALGVFLSCTLLLQSFILAKIKNRQPL